MRFIILHAANVVVAIMLQYTAFSQVSTIHPMDSTAVYMGTFTVVTSLVPSGENGPEATTSCDAEIEVSVWSIGSGRTDYTLATSSLYLDGEGELIDDIPTASIFNELAEEAVAQGTSFGYSTCSNTSSQTEMVRVYSTTCVQRIGSGSTTQFVSCDTAAYCWRSYEIVCDPFGDPFPVALTGFDGNCSASTEPACEPTCGNGSMNSLNGEGSIR